MGSHIHPNARAGPHLPALHPACWLPQVSAALTMWVIWKIELGSSALGQSFHSREDIFWISEYFSATKLASVKKQDTGISFRARVKNGFLWHRKRAVLRSGRYLKNVSTELVILFSFSSKNHILPRNDGRSGGGACILLRDMKSWTRNRVSRTYSCTGPYISYTFPTSVKKVRVGVCESTGYPESTDYCLP